MVNVQTISIQIDLTEECFSNNLRGKTQNPSKKNLLIEESHGKINQNVIFLDRIQNLLRIFMQKRKKIFIDSNKKELLLNSYPNLLTNVILRFKLFLDSTIFIRDDQQEFPNHGYYSSYIPLPQQQKLNDQLKDTFPYVQHLQQKNHIESKKVVYDEISQHIRSCVENHSVQIGWRSCLKKYLCDLDAIKALQIYVEFLKKGTQVLDQYHKKYGNGCSKQVFFHRYVSFQFILEYANLQDISNKMLKQTKTQKLAYKLLKQSIKLRFLEHQNIYIVKYACYMIAISTIMMQLSIKQSVYQQKKYNYQYVDRQNIVLQSKHVQRSLTLIRFHQNLIQSSDKQSVQEYNKISDHNIQFQEGEEQQMAPLTCSTECYNHINKQNYHKKYGSRRPIISMIQRAMIKMGTNIFSYDPCLISNWIGRQEKSQGAQGINQMKGMTCENIFFYLIEEYNIAKKLQNKFYNSEYQMLQNESFLPVNEKNLVLRDLPSKKKKKKLAFNHEDNDNYRIGCCFHYLIDQPSFDHDCEKCCCRRRGFCLPSCQCPPTCPIKKKGCSCKSGKDQCRTNKCSCFQAQQECLPGVCQNCYDSGQIHNKKNSCKNCLISMKKQKSIKIGDSNICGLGAFAGQDIQKDQLVIIYTGEMIQHQIDYIRQSLRIDDSFYNFSLHQGGSTDARFMGNKSRFINHNGGGQQNLKALSFFSQGQFRTLLNAKRPIKKGQQLFFDYDADGTLAKNFPGKYSFIDNKKKKKVTE